MHSPTHTAPFLTPSSSAKPLRILSEFMEPSHRFASMGVDRTILFFGSARAKSQEAHDVATARAREAAENPSATPEARSAASSTLARLDRTRWMCDAFVQAEELSRRLSAWSMDRVRADGSAPYVVSREERCGWVVCAAAWCARVRGVRECVVCAGVQHFCCVHHVTRVTPCHATPSLFHRS